MSTEPTPAEAATRIIDGREFKVINLDEGRTDSEIRAEVDDERAKERAHKLALYAGRRDRYWSEVWDKKRAGINVEGGPIPVVEIPRPHERHSSGARAQMANTLKWEGSLGGSSVKVPGVMRHR